MWLWMLRVQEPLTSTVRLRGMRCHCGCVVVRATGCAVRVAGARWRGAARVGLAWVGRWTEMGGRMLVVVGLMCAAEETHVLVLVLVLVQVWTSTLQPAAPRRRQPWAPAYTRAHVRAPCRPRRALPARQCPPRHPSHRPRCGLKAGGAWTLEVCRVLAEQAERPVAAVPPGTRLLLLTVQASRCLPGTASRVRAVRMPRLGTPWTA